MAPQWPLCPKTGHPQDPTAARGKQDLEGIEQAFSCLFQKHSRVKKKKLQQAKTRLWDKDTELCALARELREERVTRRRAELRWAWAPAIAPRSGYRGCSHWGAADLSP